MEQNRDAEQRDIKATERAKRVQLEQDRANAELKAQRTRDRETEDRMQQDALRERKQLEEEALDRAERAKSDQERRQADTNRSRYKEFLEKLMAPSVGFGSNIGSFPCVGVPTDQDPCHSSSVGAVDYLSVHGLKLPKLPGPNEMLDVFMGTPIGPEAQVPLLDGIMQNVERLRGKALGPSPLANQVSGFALKATGKLHRQILGEMDELSEELQHFGSEDLSSSPRSIVASNRASSQQAPHEVRKPFPLGDNLEELANTPEGYVLYRDPYSGILSVTNELLAPRSEDDDRFVGGALRCSTAGKGIVIAECERRRRAKTRLDESMSR